jgi:hypothetical protein
MAVQIQYNFKINFSVIFYNSSFIYVEYFKFDDTYNIHLMIQREIRYIDNAGT